MATSNGKRPLGTITSKRDMHELVNPPVLPPDYDPDPPKKNTSRLFAHLRYKPKDFVVPGRDSSGQSRRLYCSVSPDLAREVEIIRESKKFPFQTNGDLVRWCVYMGVKELEREEDGIKGFLPVIELATLAYQESEYRAKYEQYFEGLDKAIRRYPPSEFGMARGLISEAKMLISKMSEEFWRDKMLAEIKSRYAYLYHNVQPAKMPVDLSPKRNKVNGGDHGGEDQET